jgi:hypothetical protein
MSVLRHVAIVLCVCAPTLGAPWSLSYWSQVDRGDELLRCYASEPHFQVTCIKYH